ncbi:MAG: hypothetical protein EXR71_19435 [Myxococcales bacterium]|nr:hypothetical protein [Myxococcales bacterium]
MWVALFLRCADPSGNRGGSDTSDPGSTASDTAEELPAGDPGPTPPPETERLCRLELECAVLPTRDVKVPCELTVATESGDVDYAGSAEVWVRGRSSAQVAKPGYGVELNDGAGVAVAANLLGMGSDSDWVIDGLYYDRLLIRDKLGYDLFRSWGTKEQYAAESALCELWRNDDYFGVHALVERVKRDDDRVDIADGTETGEAFVMSQLDEDCFYTNTATYGCWKLVSPASPTADAQEQLLRLLAEWEADVVAAPTEGDWSGVWESTEMDSVIDTVLIEEVFKNEDAFYTSMHMSRDAGRGIRFIPWDLDMTFGQFPYYPYGNYGAYDVWIGYRPTLWANFAQDPAFRVRLAARWAALRAGSLDERALYDRMDELQAILGQAIVRNDEVWPIESINYGGWFFVVSSYADEDAYVRAWIHERLLWMDDHIAEY